MDLKFAMLIGGGFGAIVGTFAAPLIGFGLLRHVPLWMAIGVTAASTVSGCSALSATLRTHGCFPGMKTIWEC
jgi:hypothetical protein